MSTEQNVKIVERVWQEIVADGDLDLVDDLVAEGYTYRGPGGLEVRGPQGFRRFIASVHDLFSDIDVTVHEYIAQGDRVLSRWTGRGIHRETGRETTWHGATITHVANGKMIDDWEYWDRLEIAEQVTAGWLQRLLVSAVSKQIAEDLPDG